MILFSKRLKELRHEYNFSQDALANLLNVDQRTISNWEKGVREPDFETLARIAKFFSVSCDYLLGLID